MNDNETNTTESPQPQAFTALKCLNPNCTRDQMARGLCRNCYATAAALVRRGKITWRDLERAGKSLPSKNNIKPRSSITEWLLPAETNQ